MGEVKFYFPNEFLILLHDTPEREAFEDFQRAFSFGCVRVEQPLELAVLLLDDPVSWSLERILEIIRSQRTRAIRLPRPVPIMLVYMTVLVERDGTLFFREDVYELDQEVLKALDRGDAGPSVAPARRRSKP
jgi:murein L,D-transpeptidase YcbB/YkuD